MQNVSILIYRFLNDTTLINIGEESKGIYFIVDGECHIKNK